MDNADLVLLTAYMAEVGYSASEVAYAVEKPWKHEDILLDAKAVDWQERNDIEEGNVWPPPENVWPAEYGGGHVLIIEPPPLYNDPFNAIDLLGEMKRESDAELAARAFKVQFPEDADRRAYEARDRHPGGLL